jgi:hypothetical protein
VTHITNLKGAFSSMLPRLSGNLDPSDEAG